MNITYSNLLKAYIVEQRHEGHKAMLAVKKSRTEALKVALQRIKWITK